MVGCTRLSSLFMVCFLSVGTVVLCFYLFCPVLPSLGECFESCKGEIRVLYFFIPICRDNNIRSQFSPKNLKRNMF